MKKNNLDLSAIRELHQSGQLELAKDAYLAFLRKNPREVDALHALGIIYAQQKNYTDAAHYLETALKYQANNPVLQLHLANVLKMQGLFKQASHVLEDALRVHPDYVPALNNLGTLYYAQGKLAEASQTYQRVIQKEPDFIDAYYNLGLAEDKQNDFAAAILTYQRLLEKSPEHFAARFHLGCIFMKQDKINDALREFLTIEKAQPYHFETQSNIATCYLKKGALNEAKIHYQKALELSDDDAQILFNLGVINMQQGNVDSSIQYYQKALRIQPDLFAAHNNLGVAFLAKQHPAFALQHFQEAAALQPDNQAIQYTVTMLAQNQRLLAAPPDYVKSLFDAYADHYEPHLLNALDYKVPDHLYQTALKVIKPAPNSLDILDLGCGTGLCGMPFKHFAKSLTGVDLSDKMLDVARVKNIYDSLICKELDIFLADKKAQYDLILAGDVLMYIGDLAAIFKHVKIALRENGLFIFNAEVSDAIDYRMNQSGRFAHQKKYLDKLAAENNFKIAHYELVETRMQNNEVVFGHLYVLQSG